MDYMYSTEWYTVIVFAVCAVVAAYAELMKIFFLCKEFSPQQYSMMICYVHTQGHTEGAEGENCPGA